MDSFSLEATGRSRRRLRVNRLAELAAVIAALIAVAAITAFQLVGTNLTSTFNNVGSQL